MRRSGFTLIELIFVMVVIGVLAAIALPKFKNLKENAELSNMIAAYTTVVKNAPASYLNYTELSGLSSSEVNITSLLKVPTFNCPATGTRKNCWWKNNEDYIRYYADGSNYVQFYFYNKNNGLLGILFSITNSKNKEHFQKVLSNKLGLVFVGDKNTTIIDLTQQ